MCGGRAGPIPKGPFAGSQSQGGGFSEAPPKKRERAVARFAKGPEVHKRGSLGRWHPCSPARARIATHEIDRFFHDSLPSEPGLSAGGGSGDTQSKHAHSKQSGRRLREHLNRKSGFPPITMSLPQRHASGSYIRITPAPLASNYGSQTARSRCKGFAREVRR